MKRSSILTRIFSHNIVLLILSFLLAFVAWFIINANSQTETNVTISNIPVQISLPDTAVEKGFQIFNDTEYTASVEVSGNRVTVGSLTPSDITVTANQVSTIDHSDEYILPLSAKKTGVKSNYNIMSSVNPSSVTVFVDKFKEKDMPIDKQQMTVVIDEGYYSEVSMSNDTVHLEGAASKIDEIETVAIVDTINADGSAPMTLQETLVFLDKNGNSIDLHYVTSDIKTVEVTVTSQPKKDVNLMLTVLNAPKNAPDVELSPSAISIYGPADQLNKIRNNRITIGTLDFSQLSNKKHEFPYDFSLPDELKDCHIISENEDSVTATIDLSGYGVTTITDEIKARVDTTKYTAEIASTSTVKLTVYGPEELLSEITDSDITVIADVTKMTDQLDTEKTVSLNVPLTITLGSAYGECWVYQTDPVNVNVTPKS
ncbi:MAG: hypothetical protein IJS27_07210 [Ruminococcus sp.]|nr:hypothetical protein [Ruminococcus sp.]